MVWQRPAMSGAVLVSLLLLSASTGCASKRSGIHAPAPPSALVDIPPKDVPTRTKKIVAAPPLSLPIESESDGLLVTGYEAVHQGDWHILRHWQERSRYMIRLSPDWDQPTQRTHIEVSVQTQQRAASNQSCDDS